MLMLMIVGVMGIDIEINEPLCRQCPLQTQPFRLCSNICADVACVRLFPGISAEILGKIFDEIDARM